MLCASPFRYSIWLKEMQSILALKEYLKVTIVKSQKDTKKKNKITTQEERCINFSVMEVNFN